MVVLYTGTSHIGNLSVVVQIFKHLYLKKYAAKFAAYMSIKE